MSDTGLFSFLANAPTGSPGSYQALETRRKIALQMLANQRKGYPKNVGEGLTAIGDAIGERGVMKRMEEQQAAFDKYNEEHKPPDVNSLLPQDGAPPAAAGPVRTPVAAAADPDVVQQTEPPEPAQPQQPPVQPPPPPPPQVQPPPPPPQVAQPMTLPPQPASPMQQMATSVPTRMPGAVFPPDPSMAMSAPPSQLALPPTPSRFDDAASNGGIDQGYPGDRQITPFNTTIGQINQMGSLAPQSRGFPRGPGPQGALNDAQGAQMAELMGGPQGPGGPSYPPTASLGGSDAPDPGAVRNSLAFAMLGRPGGPQPNPTPGAGVAPPVTPQATGAGADNGIRSAPAQPPQIQLAQNGPPSAVPYTPLPTRPQNAPPDLQYMKPLPMPPPGRVPEQPANTPRTQAEIQGAALVQQGIQAQNQQQIDNGKFMIEQGKQYRDKQDADNLAAWQARKETERQFQLQQLQIQQNQALKKQELDKATAEANVARAANIITRNTNLPATAVMEDFAKRQQSVDKDVSLVRNARLAKQLLETGVVSGVGANLRVDIARARALWGNLPESELASRSERALAATKAMVGYGLNQYQPGDTRVTNSDTIVSGQIVGGDPSQQEQTRKELVNMVLEDSNRRIADYERRHAAAFDGAPGAAEQYRLRTDPIHEDPKVVDGAMKILLANPGDKHNRDMFDAHFGRGSAELEIARAERRARAGGGQ